MFDKARIKLTAWYLAIIIFITIGFTTVIFNLVSHEVDRLQQRRGMFFRPFENEIILETKARVLNFFILVDVSVVVISGGLAYLLAGKTLKPIKEMHDDQNRFVSDASHELKTPLTSLKTSFEVYLRDKNRSLKDADLVVKESVEEVDKLQHLAQSLLELAQFENNKSVLESVDISIVTQEALKVIEPLAKKRKIIIEKKISNFKVMGDKTKLTELIIILLDNAVKYSKTNSKINLIVEKNQIIVQDFGTGISAEDQKHIFDRFYRSDTARVREGKNGFGLGLSIAKKIVEEYKGKIEVESKLGEGTLFKIII